MTTAISGDEDRANIQCPNCGWTNSARARYCNGCGARLPRRCPSCDSANPPESRYCSNCGTTLSEPSPIISEAASQEKPGEKTPTGLERATPKSRDRELGQIGRTAPSAKIIITEADLEPSQETKSTKAEAERPRVLHITDQDLRRPEVEPRLLATALVGALGLVAVIVLAGATLWRSELLPRFLAWRFSSGTSLWSEPTILSEGELAPAGFSTVQNTDAHGRVHLVDTFSGRPFSFQVLDTRTGNPLKGIELYFHSSGERFLAIALDPTGAHEPTFYEAPYPEFASQARSPGRSAPVLSSRAQGGLVEILLLMKAADAAIEYLYLGLEPPQVLAHTYWYRDRCWTPEQLSHAVGFTLAIVPSPPGTSEKAKLVWATLSKVVTYAAKEDVRSIDRNVLIREYMLSVPLGDSLLPVFPFVSMPLVDPPCSVSDRRSGEVMAVPDVSGLDRGRAEALVTDAGLVVDAGPPMYDNVEAGMIVLQFPGPGYLVPRGSTVVVFESTGPGQAPEEPTPVVSTPTRTPIPPTPTPIPPSPTPRPTYMPTPPPLPRPTDTPEPEQGYRPQFDLVPNSGPMGATVLLRGRGCRPGCLRICQTSSCDPSPFFPESHREWEITVPSSGIFELQLELAVPDPDCYATELMLALCSDEPCVHASYAGLRYFYR